LSVFLVSKIFARFMAKDSMRFSGGPPRNESLNLSAGSQSGKDETPQLLPAAAAAFIAAASGVGTDEA
jgi:hypothetical protein